MRMLPVMNLLALALLTAGEKIRIPAAANRPGLGAEHAPEHDTPVSHISLRHAHDPVDAAELVVTAIAGFMKKLDERVFMRHQLPRAALPVDRVHRRHVRQPGRA